jgi:hypothetical protein
MLASAEVDRLGLDRIPFHRGEFRSLVAAITKRLLATFPAGAPVIALAALNGYWNWGFLSYRRARHRIVSNYCLIYVEIAGRAERQSAAQREDQYEMLFHRRRVDRLRQSSLKQAYTFDCCVGRWMN